MTDLSIRLFTDPILKTPCEPVTEFNEELLIILGKMFACMLKNRGAGLSANQVGINKRFCVINGDNGKTALALINPVVLQKSKKKQTMKEGCLSCPKMLVAIKRPIEILVEYQDMSGNKNTIKATDLDARIILHEIDHLDGKLIIDKYQGR